MFDPKTMLVWTLLSSFYVIILQWLWTMLSYYYVFIYLVRVSPMLSCFDCIKYFFIMEYVMSFHVM